MSAQPSPSPEPHLQQEQQEPPQEKPSAEADGGPGQPSRRRAVWLRRAALALIAALAGVLYAWSISQDTLEYYYAAAVRSMSSSWHNFIFAAVDPAGTITLDKLPGAFWVQALAVRAFGLHAWVIAFPQAVEGVLTVLVLYRAVSRLAGPAAGLIAALAIAVSPATVALNRGNISDSLMILLLVLAADSVSAAITTAKGRGVQARLILAAFWVGLAFQAGMDMAWLVLPALGLAFLLDGPGPLARRLRQLVVAGIVAAIVSLTWMTAVSLVPAADRPYADGSSNNSVYAQVFVYNGFGRFGDQTPVQLLTSQLGLGPALDQDLSVTEPGAGRLFTGNLGRDTGWLLPAAFLAAIWGIASRWRRPRGDGLRACFVLWGAWLLTLTVTFSAATFVQAYYMAVLTPAIAAILSTALVSVFKSPDTSRAGGAAGRGIGLAVVSAGTTAYAVWLVPAQGAHVPGWLVPAIIAVGAAAVAVAVGSALVKRSVPAAAAVAAVLAAALVAPAVASAGLAANHEGFADAPFEPTRLASLSTSGPAQIAAVQQKMLPSLGSLRGGAPDLMAVQSSAFASVFIYTSGLEVLPIGGFTGTIPSPTLSDLEADIRSGQFHLVLALTTTDPRIQWIAAHCRHMGGHTYYCVPADAP
jgi:4-amino-4-deoxy-L-arabinose transferase-like glycosyltransferase